MTAGWHFVIHQAALESLEGLRRDERRRVRLCIERLLSDLRQKPDAERRTAKDRTL